MVYSNRVPRVLYSSSDQWYRIKKMFIHVCIIKKSITPTTHHYLEGFMKQNIKCFYLNSHFCLSACIIAYCYNSISHCIEKIDYRDNTLQSRLREFMTLWRAMFTSLVDTDTSRYAVCSRLLLAHVISGLGTRALPNVKLFCSTR